MTRGQKHDLFMRPFTIIVLVLILARATDELWLSRLNQRHVCAQANEVPPAFRGIIDEPMYRRSIDYTLAKSRFGDIAGVFDAALLIAVLFSGVLPWAFGRDRKSTRLNSSHQIISYAVFCLKKKNKIHIKFNI